MEVNIENNTSENKDNVQVKSKTQMNKEKMLKKKEKIKNSAKVNTKSEEEINKLREDSLKINSDYINFYKDNLEFSNTDFEEFIRINETEMPIVFRVNEMNPYSAFTEDTIMKLLKKLDDYDNRVKITTLNNTKVYQINKLVKTNPVEKAIQNYLTLENDIGILRQEFVSMIPITLTDINSDDIILDSCAAPGSKTLQLMEKLHFKSTNSLPKGVIWANEIDNKRAQMLIHLTQNHPTLNLVVTNNDARTIPINKHLQPDTVICDVPCSGDGTIRKNKQIKKSWDLRHSYTKHELQKTILENCVNIVKTGGTVVYSTCAINPIENEAVIASVVEKYKEYIEIVDVSDILKSNNVKFREGLCKWKVYLDSKNLSHCGSFSDIRKIKEEVKNNGGEYKFKNDISESMFHNIYTEKNFTGKLTRDPLGLKKCIRLYSHDNDTGNFFICVLKKTKQISFLNKEIKYYDVMPIDNKLKQVNTNNKTNTNKDNNNDNETNNLETEDHKEVVNTHNNKFLKNHESHILNEETEMIGKNIEDDLLEFCDHYNIRDEKINVILKEKEERLKSKQKEYDEMSVNSNKDYDEMNLELFNQYISVQQMLEDYNLLSIMEKEMISEKDTTNTSAITNTTNTTSTDINTTNINEQFKQDVNQISKHGIPNIYEHSREILKWKSHFSIINETLLSSLFLNKIALKRLYLFSEKLSKVIESLAENNFKVMYAGTKVFETAKYKKTVSLCKFRFTYQGVLCLNEYIGSQIVDLNKLLVGVCKLNEKSSEAIMRKIIEKLILELDINKDKIKSAIKEVVGDTRESGDSKGWEYVYNCFICYVFGEEDEDVKDSVIKSLIKDGFNYTNKRGSCVLRIFDLILPIHVGTNTINSMIPENIIAVLKQHVGKYYLDN